MASPSFVPPSKKERPEVLEEKKDGFNSATRIAIIIVEITIRTTNKRGRSFTTVEVN